MGRHGISAQIYLSELGNAPGRVPQDIGYLQVHSAVSIMNDFT